MTEHAYSPERLRVGAACPRAHHFDAAWARRHPGEPRVTELSAGGAPAGGAMLHRALSAFARADATPAALESAVAAARTAGELHERLARYLSASCFPPRHLEGLSIQDLQAFVGALHGYLGELAASAVHARQVGHPPSAVAGRLLGDAGQDVDVTIEVAEGEAARVAGSIDTAFFDWRTGRHRILDFRVSRDADALDDVVQASTVAMAHQLQHASTPDVTVHYLQPRPSRASRTWEEIHAARVEVYDHLASLIAWEAFDAETGAGLLPPGRPGRCGGCRWSDQCATRLGPKETGARASEWADRRARGDRREPAIAARAPATVGSVAAEPARGVQPDRTSGGLWVGMRDAGPVVASPAILNTHVAVVGAAGSGKTWTAKVLAEEAVRSGAPVLVIDPQGDLVQLLRRRDESEIEPALRPAFREYWERVEPRIYTPGSSHARRLCLSPIRLPSADELARVDTPERRLEEERGVLFSVAANLAGLAGLRGDRPAAETFLYRILLALPRHIPVTIERVVEAIRDPDAIGIDEPGQFIKPATRKNLELGLNNIVAGPSSALFAGGEPLDLDAMVTPTRPGRVPLNVIYLNAMAHDGHKQFFVAALAAEIYRWMVTRLSTDGSRTNLLFYIDEARDFIPAGTAETPSKQPLLRLFRQGRKYGVACLLCTQSPRSVDLNAFGNCSTKIIGRLEASQDVERVKEWFTTDGAPSWLDGRKRAEKGSFVARWAVGDEGKAVQFRGRQLFSVHEGAWSPDRVEREVRRG